MPNNNTLPTMYSLLVLASRAGISDIEYNIAWFTYFELNELLRILYGYDAE